MAELSLLRPVERRMMALKEAGHDEAAIAVKFRRSRRFVRQVLALGGLRGATLGVSVRTGPAEPGGASRSELSPRQRVVLRWRSRGASYAEIASRLRRSPSYVGRLEAIALSRSTRRPTG